MKHSKRQTALLALIAMSLLMTACNTVRGLGRDIESVGRSGEEAIN